MPRPKPETFVFTTVTHQRRAVFQRTENAELVIATLARYREKGEFLLHAFVVMPDHIHVILTPRESIERAAQLIKGGLSFQLRKTYPGTVWQAGYHEHRIRNQDDLTAQTLYIANNPAAKNHADYHHVHTMHPGLIDPWGGMQGGPTSGAKAHPIC